MKTFKPFKEDDETYFKNKLYLAIKNNDKKLINKYTNIVNMINEVTISQEELNGQKTKS